MKKTQNSLTGCLVGVVGGRGSSMGIAADLNADCTTATSDPSVVDCTHSLAVLHGRAEGLHEREARSKLHEETAKKMQRSIQPNCVAFLAVKISKLDLKSK